MTESTNPRPGQAEGFKSPVPAQEQEAFCFGDAPPGPVLRGRLDPIGDPSPNCPDVRPGRGSPFRDVDQETGEIRDPRREYLRAAYRLRNDARRLLPRNAFKGLHQCGLPVNGAGGSVSIVLHSETGRAHWSGTISCGSPWVCPVCARKIGARRSEEIETAAGQWIADGGRLFFATLTVPHLRKDDLHSLMDAFAEARRRLLGSGTWRRWRYEHGVVGLIIAQEVTWGRNGWHPHAHLLVFVAGEVAPGDLHGVLFPLWARAVRAVGLGEVSPGALHVVEVAERADVEALAEYMGAGPSKGGWGWGLGAELAGQAVKGGQRGLAPFELLAVASGRRVVEWLPQERAVALWREYAEATKGRRHLVWSPGLKALFGIADRSDEEVANEPGEGEVVAEVAAADYLLLRERGLLAEPLELVEDYGVETALAWIRWVVRTLGPRGPGPPAACSGRGFSRLDAYMSGVRG